MYRSDDQWRIRTERENSTEDHVGIRRVLEAAFETAAEADLVDALRNDSEHWLQRYSILGAPAAISGSRPETFPVAYALLHRCTVGGKPGLILAPVAVLPQHQGAGAGSAVIKALLQRAKDDGEPFVLVYGSPQYYERFGFTPASEAGITAQWVTQTPALQIRILDETATIPTGEVKLPAAYGL